MFFIDFDPFLFFLMGFDCFEHDGGRCGWGTVWMGTALNKFDLIGCVFIGRELRQVGQRGAQRFPISAQSGVKLVNCTTVIPNPTKHPTSKGWIAL